MLSTKTTTSTVTAITSKNSLQAFNIGPFRFTKDRVYVFNCASMNDQPCAYHPNEPCILQLKPGYCFLLRLGEINFVKVLLAETVIDSQPACVFGFLCLHYLTPAAIEFLTVQCTMLRSTQWKTSAGSGRRKSMVF